MKRKQLIRANFRDAVFKRDGYKCVLCDETENLDAHHITDRTLMPNGGYVLENGITLCPQHHLDAEKFHSTDGFEFVPGVHPFDLYDIIESSPIKAYHASKRLDTA